MKNADGEISFPTYSEAESVFPAVKDLWTYLFTIDETAYYLVSQLPFEELPDYSLEKTDSLRTLSPRHLIFAGITGHQLYKWVSRPQILRLLRQKDETGQKRTHDVLP